MEVGGKILIVKRMADLHTENEICQFLLSLTCGIQTEKLPLNNTLHEEYKRVAIYLEEHSPITLVR